MLTHIDLFTGIGGFALAAQWAGFYTLAFVEIDDYCRELIKKNFGAVADADGERRQQERRGSLGDEKAHGREGRDGREPHRHNFVAGYGEGRCPRLLRDIRDFDGTAYRGATLLTGGFPCQPFSQAGKRRGAADDRALWPEMFRVICEARPAWVIGENVAGLVTMELDRVLSDLEGEGYACQPLVIPACAVDARHRRDRVWIVAHAARHEQGRQEQRAIGERAGICGESINAMADAAGPRRDDAGKHDGRPSPLPARLEQCGEAMADAESTRLQGRTGPAMSGEWRAPIESARCCEWQPEPGVLRMAVRLPDELDEGERFYSYQEEWEGVPRVATGVKNRVQRLKGLGNSIQPQVAYEILREIAILEQHANT